MKFPFALSTLALLLAGCSQVPTTPQAPAAPAGAAAPLALTIVHVNDHHSNLEPHKNFSLKLDGQPLTVDLGGFARVATVIRERAARGGAVLKVHAGDANTGTLFNTVFEGEADAAVMNAVCFDSFTLGNHEFDASDAGLAKFLGFLRADPTCKTPVLSANITPAAGTPLRPADAPSTAFQPYTVRQVNGVAVGIVGVTVKQKTVISSRPLTSTRFDDEVEATRAAIAALKAQGVRHIIVASHFGYGNERLLASRLPEVDVVIGGDSHTLLGEPLKAFGLPAQGPYPTLEKNADGDTVCIAQAWEYSKAVGVLDVRFDAQGRIAGCGGEAIVPVGSNFQRDKKPLDADAQAALLKRLAAVPAGTSSLRVVEPDPAVAALIAGYRKKLDTAMNGRIGAAPQPLCHVRVPGAPATPACGPRGSDTAQWVAQAFLDAARRADVALQNAGGVRIGVPAGELSYDTAYKVLPFSNTLVELDMTGAEIVAALEDGVSNWFDAAANGFRGSDGSHPYAAGLRWSLNLDAPKGQRFTAVEVRDRSSGRWAPIDMARKYVLVTNDYIASGRDGFTTLGKVWADKSRSVDTGLYYTQTFVEAITRARTLVPLPQEQYSNQQVVTSRPLPTRN
jgi:5'-nucleotidase / UDP-sugar diphosphatase